MSRVVIIGAGGVGGVVAHKCAQLPEVFTQIVLASRTLERCQRIAAEVAELQGRSIEVAQVDADSVEEMRALLKRTRPELVINVALPYQDLSIMEACLAEEVHYLDTANYEPRDRAHFEYSWQWAYGDRYRKAHLMAVLGAGFDPGVTNAFCAHASRELFDKITQIDILDCNAGDHGHPFATNFNPEINIREITQRGRYWEDGAWHETEPLTVSQVFDFPEVGPRKAYLIFHEELESLAKNLPGLQSLKFWMTFGDEYLTHLRVLGNVGMTRIDPVDFQGQKIVPLQFLKALLPDPSTLAPTYHGKTSIGCLIQGVRSGKPRRVFIYNVCDHAEAYREVRAQAISYTTGVPAVAAAKIMLTGEWTGEGVLNVEQLPPAPLLRSLAELGLPWQVQER